MENISYVQDFLKESGEILKSLNTEDIESMAAVLAEVKQQGGRLFFAGSGGGAGHASHATADFRKIAGMEAYSVSDNVSELTARINDESWDVSYSNWLKGSRIGPRDCLFVFSVGGGNSDRNVSMNLVNAIDHAIGVGASVVGVVGRDGGHLRKVATASICVPNPTSANVTTQTEGFQALMWHLLVTHPRMQSASPMWESITI
jgi:D-sedoheptulose 7-phosphate isomerase